MKKLSRLLIILTLLIYSKSNKALSQPWTSNSACDLTNGVQWNNGGATPCACTWYSVSGIDTTLNCAYGDCGQAAFDECIDDCNGHNGNPTDMVPRTCDATASPICWYQGAGNTAGADFCAGIALPIELYEFGGESINGINEIYWKTASEIDNDYFVISYSTDGISFIDLVEIQGAGTSITQQNYVFRHINPKIGIGYYKLKQVDYNGEYKEYTIISITNKVEISDNNIFSNIYPNPSKDIFYFLYGGHVYDEPINIKITNLLGEVLLIADIINFNNSQGMSFDLSILSKGSYNIIISQGDITETKKIQVIN
jgi:hypothetical protein